METMNKNVISQTSCNFKGDIIITDPCYITNDEDWETFVHYDYIEISSAIGTSLGLVADTGIGDWSNSITDKNGNELGTFCADAGMVCVFLLEDVLKYNPSLELPEHIATIIPNFEGTVSITLTDFAVITGEGNINFSSEEDV